MERSGGGRSSRESPAGAGWRCEAGRFAELVPARRRPFSWLDPTPLWRSRDDRLARWLGDPTNDRRRAWMAGRGGDLVVGDYADREAISFLVMGDTGEGDGSQYAVVPPLLSRAAGTAFLFICSDVIYPAGGIAEYRDKFFRPYRDYPAPIYAVPGNHDWYDDLVGFMFHLCGAEQRPPRAKAAFASAGWLRDLLASRPKAPDPVAVAEMRAMRASPGQQGRQPGPYLAIDSGPLRLVGIDTGITGSIDRDQAAWLRRVSAESPRPKILLTGKPIYVDAAHHPGPIEGGGHVDDILTAPEHNYIAAIGGDIHNYQRYPVRIRDGRTIQHVVAGGGGAFMHSTHQIPLVALPGVGEADFRCYPLRGDSLSLYSLLYDRRLAGGRGRLFVPPDQAAAIIGERLGLAPTRPSAQDVTISPAARRAAATVFPLPSRGRGALHLPFSQFFDWNDPPLFKSFLRVDATPDRVSIRCFAATGCRDHEDDPPVEDAFHAERGGDGRWRWSDDAR
jgi:hypothetical protein